MLKLAEDSRERKLTRSHFLELQDKYSCAEFYTDASKSHAGVAYAALGSSFSMSGALNPHTSIFTAEAYAILTAVKYIKQINVTKAIVFTDSLSVVRALMSLRKHKNPVCNELYSLLCSAYMGGQVVIICWVPGHKGIKGNVAADESATSVNFEYADTKIAIPPTDLKPFLRQELRKCWQRNWDSEVSNKLHTVKPRIGNWIFEKATRYKEVLLCRLRIGHTYGTHSYLLNGNDPPRCDGCGDTLTVLHVLIQCPEIETQRKKYFHLAYREHIPLHPAFFLSNEPLFDSKTVLKFLEDVNKLQIIWPGHL